MDATQWSWVLAGGNVFTMALIGRGGERGWLFGAMWQIPWAIFSVVTAQWGFLVLSTCYSYIYIRVAVRERRLRRLAEELYVAPWNSIGS